MVRIYSDSSPTKISVSSQQMAFHHITSIIVKMNVSLFLCYLNFIRNFISCIITFVIIQVTINYNINFSFLFYYVAYCLSFRFLITAWVEEYCSSPQLNVLVRTFWMDAYFCTVVIASVDQVSLAVWFEVDKL